MDMEKAREHIEQEECPYCGAGRYDLSYESPEIDGKEAHQKVTCMVCEGSFTEVYLIAAAILTDAPDTEVVRVVL
jgi:hypothetical protein